MQYACGTISSKICHNWTCQAILPLIVVPIKAIVVPYFQAIASYAYVLDTTNATSTTTNAKTTSTSSSYNIIIVYIIITTLHHHMHHHRFTTSSHTSSSHPT